MRFLVIYFLFVINCVYSQENEKAIKNAIYGELLGNGGTWVSINYERLFNVEKISFIKFGARVGFTYAKNRYDSKIGYNFPIEIIGLVGKKVHYFELGFGYTPYFGTSDLNSPQFPEGYKTNYDFMYVGRFGYRYVENNKFLFRVAPLLLIGHSKPQSSRLVTRLGFGISMGYCW